jgi:CPA1 family monovalent cation:H+ antiporter
VVAGVTLRTYGRRVGMSVRTREALDTVWEFLAFVLTTLTFVLIGLAISLPSLAGAVLPITWGVLAVLAARVLKTYALVGGAARLVLRRRRGVARDGLPLGWLHILFWSGLRGAVAVALALSLPTDIPQRALLQEITFGIVLFTLVVQGMSIDALARHVLAGPTSARPAHSVS